MTLSTAALLEKRLARIAKQRSERREARVILRSRRAVFDGSPSDYDVCYMGNRYDLTDDARARFGAAGIVLQPPPPPLKNAPPIRVETASRHEGAAPTAREQIGQHHLPISEAKAPPRPLTPHEQHRSLLLGLDKAAAFTTQV